MESGKLVKLENSIEHVHPTDYGQPPETRINTEFAVFYQIYVFYYFYQYFVFHPPPSGGLVLQVNERVYRSIFLSAFNCPSFTS